MHQIPGLGAKTRNASSPLNLGLSTPHRCRIVIRYEQPRPIICVSSASYQANAPRSGLDTGPLAGCIAAFAYAAKHIIRPMQIPSALAEAHLCLRFSGRTVGCIEHKPERYRSQASSWNNGQSVADCKRHRYFKAPWSKQVDAGPLALPSCVGSTRPALRLLPSAFAFLSLHSTSVCFYHYTFNHVSRRCGSHRILVAA